MSTLLLICGWGGSGKDYAVDEICKDLGLKDAKVLSYTTRKPRYEGESTHTFIDEEFYEACKEKGNILAYTYQNNAHYFVTPECLKDKKFYIIDKPGVEYMLKKIDDNKDLDNELKMNGIDNLLVIYLDPNKLKVAYNLLFRRKLSLSDTIKRMWQDYKIYKGMRKTFPTPLVFKHQRDMIDYIENIWPYLRYKRIMDIFSK